MDLIIIYFTNVLHLLIHLTTFCSSIAYMVLEFGPLLCVCAAISLNPVKTHTHRHTKLLNYLQNGWYSFIVHTRCPLATAQKKTL